MGMLRWFLSYFDKPSISTFVSWSIFPSYTNCSKKSNSKQVDNLNHSFHSHQVLEKIDKTSIRATCIFISWSTGGHAFFVIYCLKRHIYSSTHSIKLQVNLLSTPHLKKCLNKFSVFLSWARISNTFSIKMVLAWQHFFSVFLKPN